MAKKKEDTKEKLAYVQSQTPTTSTDFMQLAMSKKGTVFMQLMSVTPDNIYENHRTIISAEYVNELIDDLCALTKYYPEKPSQKKNKPKNASSKK